MLKTIDEKIEKVKFKLKRSRSGLVDESVNVFDLIRHKLDLEEVRNDIVINQFKSFFVETPPKKMAELQNAYKAGKLFAFNRHTMESFKVDADKDVMELMHTKSYLFGTAKPERDGVQKMVDRWFRYKDNHDLDRDEFINLYDEFICRKMEQYIIK